MFAELAEATDALRGQLAESEALSRRIAKDQAASEANLREAELFESGLNEAMAHYRDGDFSMRISETWTDEGRTAIAASVNALIEDIDAALDQMREVLNALSHGDLSGRLPDGHRGVFLQLKNAVDASMDTLAALIGEITESAEAVSSRSEAMRSASENLAKRAEHNAATLEETSAALEAFSASVSAVARNVGETTRDAMNVKRKAEAIGDVTKSATRSIQIIAARSEEIETVINMIEDISFQINFLALNAGVEAARAGEAARGFTLVASEVRALAQRTTEVVSSVTDVIDANKTAVTSGSAEINRTSAALGAIVASVVEISS